MQTVYKDGSVGMGMIFNEILLSSLIQDPAVDHVRVFNLDGGNKIGIPQIEDSVLEAMVEKKIESTLQKREILNTFNSLPKNPENFFGMRKLI
jgi:hypothetical protein